MWKKIKLTDSLEHNFLGFTVNDIELSLRRYEITTQFYSGLELERWQTFLKNLSNYKLYSYWSGILRNLGLMHAWAAHALKLE